MLKPTIIENKSPNSLLLITLTEEFKGSKLYYLVYMALIAVFFQRQDVSRLQEDDPVLWGKLHVTLQEVSSAITGYQCAFDQNPIIGGLDSLRFMEDALRLQSATRKFFNVVGGHTFVFNAVLDLAAGPKLLHALECMGLEIKPMS